RREQLLLGGIVRPRARAEAEYGVVCHLDCFGCIAYAENGRDRTENFFAVGRRFSRYVDKNRWLVKKSATVNAISARQQFRAGGDRFLNLLVDPVQNLFRREWTKLSRLVHGISNLQRAHALDELAQKIIKDVVGHEKALCRDARLAAVDRARFDCRAQCAFKIRAWHDDKCVATAKLEHALFVLTSSGAPEIGRASCRERVWSSVLGGVVNKK